MARNTALIAGALGNVGRALVHHLDGDAQWDVIGLSRRSPDFETGARFISNDLLDRADTESKLGGLVDVTHVFFTAETPRDDDAEMTTANMVLLRNLVETIEPIAPNLKHIQLMQGVNWYGNHRGPFKTPAREDDSRIMPPMFYYDQQDWLAAHQVGKAWNWSALKPQGIYGFAVGSPMSQLNGLAIYGAISRELGLPMRFPGQPGTFTAVYQFTDAALLARCMVWAATAPAAANQDFNITNGDVMRWCNLWPKVAEFFGIESGPVATVRLAEVMADKEPLWAEMRAKYGLRDYRIADLVDWHFPDAIYSQAFDQISNLNKIRKAGWSEVVDSEEMLIRLLGELRRDRIIP